MNTTRAVQRHQLKRQSILSLHKVNEDKQSYFRFMSVIEGLFTYPLKSCQANAHDSIAFDSKGLEHDRQLALVGEDNRLLTGRQFPELTRIEVLELSNESLLLRHNNQTHRFALQSNSTALTHHYDKDFYADFVSPDADSFFSQLLGIACRLGRNAADEARYLNPKYGKEKWEVRMVDSSPILLINSASVDLLNSKLNVPIDPLCFRPNLIVSGFPAGSELSWKKVRIGSHEFEVNTSCKRCRFTTLTPGTKDFRQDGEPLRTLSSYSRTAEGKVQFGIYLLPMTSGQLKLGDTVELLD